MANALQQALVLTHPCIIGEIALGHLRNRNDVLASLLNLPRALAATDAEVLKFIEENKLFGSGTGYIDAQLLAAARLTGAQLWTKDRRLAGAADRLGVAFGA